MSAVLGAPLVPLVARITAPRALGRGEVHCARVAGASAVLRASAAAPLKLLLPRPRGESVWVCAATFGGGLLEHDRICLSVTVGAGASALLSTQSSTKIYRSGGGLTCAELSATIGPGATLALLPDALTCFAGAAYRQHQSFELAPDGNLLLLDWMTSGRAARGERWAFTTCHTSTLVGTKGKTLWRDATLMTGGALLATRMGRFHVLANVLLLGPAFAAASAQLSAAIAGMPVVRQAALIVSASRVGDGVLLRLAATNHELAELTLRRLLAPACAKVGGDPWLRRS